MLKRDNTGTWSNWEESQLFLEQEGYLDRAIFETEVVQLHNEQNYALENAVVGFGLLLSNHLYQRIKQKRPEYADYPNIHAQPDRTSIIYVGMITGNVLESYCATPDWLNALFYHEADQHLIIKWHYPPGTLLYNAQNDRVYVVFENNMISQAEADDLEDANDIFGAAGSYSHLCYPRTEEEQQLVHAIHTKQQGTIGGIEALEAGSLYIHCRPFVLLPGKGQTFAFQSDTGLEHKEHRLMEYPDSFDPGYWFDGKKPNERLAALEAEKFLRKRYPEIRIVEWSEFQQLQAQRI